MGMDRTHLYRGQFRRPTRRSAAMVAASEMHGRPRLHRSHVCLPRFPNSVSIHPFVGRAGKLLDKMLNAIKLDRKKVYISNVVNYRPPLNRRPTEDEIERYFPYLKSHIEIINPKILVLLGSTALNTLIGNEEVISKARGKWIRKEIGTITPWIIASFHPAFLMRQPEQKKLAWIDLKMIRDKSKILKI